MEHIVNEILEWCQNDKEYLQELIDRLQEIANTEDDEYLEQNTIFILRG